MTISDGFKKLTLAAIGAGAITYEKTSELLGQLVEKGEITVEQGKVINSELKHNVKESVKQSAKQQKDIAEEAVDLVSRLSDEQIAAFKKAIDSLDHNEDEVKTETAEKDDAHGEGRQEPEK